MPYTREQTEAIKAKRKATILDESLKLFAINGYDAVTIDDIAKASKMTHSLFYHYFKSKEEIFKKLLELAKDTRHPFIVDESLNPKTKIHELIVNVLSVIAASDKSTYYLYLFLNIHFQKTLNLKKPKDSETIFGALYRYIEEGQKEGTIIECDPKELIMAFASMLSGLAYTSIKNQDKKIMLPSDKTILNLFLAK